MTTFEMIKIVDPAAATMIAQLRVGVPSRWNTLVTESVANNIQGPSLITDRMFAGLLTPKAFTSLLLPHVRNVKAIEQWQLDLDCEIEMFLWDAINKKSRILFLTNLRDFHVQFLNRAFHYNEQISKYRPEQSTLCDFCKQSPESYLHLFWECQIVTPLWVAVQDICYEYVDAEEFSPFKCLMSNFQSTLLNLIMTIVKNYIHVCKWTSQSPTVTGFVKALNRA